MSFKEKYLKYKAKYLELKSGFNGEEEKEWIYPENKIKLPEETMILYQMNPPLPPPLNQNMKKNQLKPDYPPLIQILTYNVSRTSMNDNHINCNNRICSNNIITFLEKNKNSSEFILLQEAEDIHFNNILNGMTKISLFNNTCITYYDKSKSSLVQNNIHGGYFMPNYPYLIAHFERKGKDYLVINVDLPKTSNENQLINELKKMQINMPNWLKNLLGNNSPNILIGGDFHSKIYTNPTIFNRIFLKEDIPQDTCCDDNLNNDQLIYKDDHLLRTTDIFLWRYKSFQTGKKHSNHIPMIYQIILDN